MEKPEQATTREGLEYQYVLAYKTARYLTKRAGKLSDGVGKIGATVRIDGITTSAAERLRRAIGFETLQAQALKRLACLDVRIRELGGEPDEVLRASEAFNSSDPSAHIEPTT